MKTKVRDAPSSPIPKPTNFHISNLSDHPNFSLHHHKATIIQQRRVQLASCLATHWALSLFKPPSWPVCMEILETDDPIPAGASTSQHWLIAEAISWSMDSCPEHDSCFKQ